VTRTNAEHGNFKKAQVMVLPIYKNAFIVLGLAAPARELLEPNIKWDINIFF
jgi:hypothetical protein